MSQTRDQIASKILENLENVGASFFTSTDVNNSIQDAYDDITCYCGQIEKSALVSLQANLSYYDLSTLISDYLAVTAIYNYTTSKWLENIGRPELDLKRWDWELWEGNLQWFFPLDVKYIGVCPRVNATTGTMEVFYRAKANTLSASSVPFILKDYSKLIEFYATGDLLESIKEFVKADIWLSQYLELRERYKIANKQLANADRILTRSSSLRGI